MCIIFANRKSKSYVKYSKMIKSVLCKAEGFVIVENEKDRRTMATDPSDDKISSQAQLFYQIQKGDIKCKNATSRCYIS